MRRAAQISSTGHRRAHAGETHYLRVYMAQLRRKIEADPARPQLLVTEPSVGYRMRDQG